MKQHITVGHLNELSEKGKEKLKEWWWSKLDETDQWVEKDAHRIIGSAMFPTKEWMTIGRMIEFLDEHWTFEKYQSFCILKERGWGVGDYNEPSGIESINYFASRVFTKNDHFPELCDALWAAVKEVLEKE